MFLWGTEIIARELEGAPCMQTVSLDTSITYLFDADFSNSVAQMHCSAWLLWVQGLFLDSCTYIRQSLAVMSGHMKAWFDPGQGGGKITLDGLDRQMKKKWANQESAASTVISD